MEEERTRDRRNHRAVVVSTPTKTLAEQLDEKARSMWRLGSFGCPTCGRFARVTAQGQDHNGEHWFRVDCKKCGVGVGG